MAIEIVNHAARQRWELFEDNELAAVLVYRLVDGVEDMVHVEVDADRGGRGLAALLVAHALDDARDRRLFVLPSCPYVHRFIDERRDGYLDLVPPERRGDFGFE